MNKKVKLAFVLAGIGIFAAAALRCVQMLCFFDYDTGFVTDSGLLTYICCGAAIGVSLLCMLLCRVDKKLCARIETKRNAAAGASALLMCVFLFLCAAALLRDFYLYRNNQPTYFVQASHVTTHLPFAVLTLLFAIVSLIFAIIWLTGEGFPSGTGGLWAIGSVWGISYMIVTFMTYSAVATTEENIFTVGGGAMMLLFLLSEGKLLSGAGGKKALRSVCVRPAGSGALDDVCDLEHGAHYCGARVCDGDAVCDPACDAVPFCSQPLPAAYGERAARICESGEQFRRKCFKRHGKRVNFLKITEKVCIF